MKVNEHKVKRYQAGGFMIYQPLPLQPPQAPVEEPVQEGSTPTQTSSVIDDKLIQKLLGNGITNDVMAFKSQVENAYLEYENMSEAERQTAHGRNLRSVMKGDFAIINKLLRSKQLFDESLKRAETNDSLSDIAISNNGMLIKNLQTGQLFEVTHEEFSSKYRNNSNFKPITNGELANEREYNDYLINDFRSIEILNNSIGTNKVKEEVVKILSNIGSEKSSVSKDQYIYFGAETPEKLRAAASELIGMGIDGIYKITKTQTTESNQKHLLAAREAMWMNLSPQAKSLLKAKAALNGDRNVEEAAKEYAIALLDVNSKTDVSETIKTDYDAKMTEDAGVKGSKESETLNDDIGYWQQLQSGAADMAKMTVDLGNGNTTEVFGFTPGVMLSDGKVVGPTSLRNIKELSGITNRNSVSIGGNKVPKEEWDAIVYEGQEVIKVKFPSKTLQDGSIVPDFERADQFNNLMQKLESLPTVAAREELITKSGFSSDGRGNINPGEAHDFIVFDGMINEKALGGIKDNRLLEQVKDSEKDFYENLYIKNSPDSETDYEHSGAHGFGFWDDNIFSSNDVYRGRVFIALEGNRYVTARNLDGKGLNTTKEMNSPYYLGNAKNMVQQNGRNNGVLYSLTDGK